MPHTKDDEKNETINKLLDDIEQVIGLDGRLRITCGVQTFEGRKLHASWRRSDRGQERSLYAYWLSDLLLHILLCEKEWGSNEPGVATFPLKRKPALPHARGSDFNETIDKLLEDIQTKIGDNGNLVITCGAQTFEGRQFRAEWRRCDEKQYKREGGPSALRSLHGFWIDELLRKIDHFEQEVEDGWAAEDAMKAQGQTRPGAAGADSAQE